MRITIPVSGDGDAWMSHLPEFDFDARASELVDANGRLVVEKVVSLFKEANEVNEARFGRPIFTFGSEDWHNVLSIAIEFLRQLSIVTHYLEGKEGSNAHLSADGSQQDRRLERRMARDQVAFCRIDVRSVANGVKFVVGYGNPKERVIGNCENGAHEFAIYVTRVLISMVCNVNQMSKARNAGLTVTVEGRDAGLVEEAMFRERVGREKDKLREVNAKRATCPYNRGGVCSPAVFYCRCYKNGNCVEAELPDELKERS